MIRFFNKFLGALLRLLVFTPFFMLAMVCVPLLFLDRLLQRRPMDAFLELMRLPLKILFLLVIGLQTFSNGWGIGLAALVSTLRVRIKNFFHYEIWTNADFFFSVDLLSEDIINHYEGPLFGYLIRKIIALSLPYEFFKSYEAFHESPHNSDSTRDINAVYTALRDSYENRLWEQANNVEQKINEFLQMRIKNAATPEEIKFAKAAENCYRQFKENFSGNYLTVALDVASAPKPLWTLYLVWMALEEEATEEQSAQLKECLASFMTQIQRGVYRSHNPTDTEIYIEDQPECSTGAVAILLEVLKSLPNSRYKLAPPKIDGVQRLRELIHLKLNDNYNVRNHLFVPLGAIEPPIAEGSFKKLEKRPLSHYARFLVQTPQGNRLLNGKVNLDEEDIQATVDATLDEWRPRP